MIVDYIDTSNSNIVDFKKSNESKERDVTAYLGAG
jgi:hypothetical protein